MEIKLGKTLRVSRADDRNYVIETQRTIQDGKNKGSEVWKITGYYPKLEQALMGLLDLKISKADVSSVEQLLDTIGAAKREIVEAVS